MKKQFIFFAVGAGDMPVYSMGYKCQSVAYHDKAAYEDLRADTL